VGVALTVGLLAGCSSLNPVNWWHREQGGKIAEQRPPPPGADDPYPNLSTVPGKPTALDADAMKALTASLVADRTNAQHAAQAAPLADPSSPTASPSLFGVGTAPPPGSASASPPPAGTPPPAASPPNAAPSNATASMPAVTAPPAPPAPAPTPAPRRPVESAPLTAPTPSPPTAAAPSPPPETLAPLPEAPPPRPGAAGSPPPPIPAPVVMPPQVAGVASATIVFVEGATSLSPPAAEEVKAFAAKRTTGSIVVTGYGDAASSDPASQSAAVVLGLTRAQAVAEALKQAGIPGNAIRVSAEASGRGASLRLLQ
jgi:outer membrane protein OmpA-like peptidoglycan-associated protein